MFDLVIKNARIAQADGTITNGDLACKNGRIASIREQISNRSRETVDASGHLLLPGVIDPQVHFRDPGAPQKEDLASGSRAAVSGGVTSFLEMPNTHPATIGQQALDEKLKIASQKCVANYGFFIGATTNNLKALNECQPVCGIKIFMGSSTGNLLVNDKKDLDHIFASGNRLIAVHAEDEARIRERSEHYLGSGHSKHPDVSIHSVIRDAECAVLATQVALELSEKYQRRLHILHLSTAREAELLARKKPRWVTAEVIPNHLFLNQTSYQSLGSLVQMNPPVRSKHDNEILWQQLRAGVIDFIATDHAPHTLAEKEVSYPNSPSGMPGVEISLRLMLTAMKEGRCNLKELQRWMCSGPAKAYGIENKGRIAEDWDADLTIVDIDNKRQFHKEHVFSRAGWSPYQGQMLYGWTRHTIVNGQITFAEGKIRQGCHGKALTFSAASTSG